MNKKLLIKICGMREPSNIREVVSLNPDFIGLIFYPKSKRYIVESNAPEIISQIPSTIKKVGVFVNDGMEQIIRKIKLFGLNMVQLHGEESPDFCNELKKHQVGIIKSFGIDINFDFSLLSDYQNACDYFLFDTKTTNYGGTGIRFDWSILKKYDNSKPFFLSGGIGPGDQADIQKIQTKELNLVALDLNSKFELSPGIKNAEILSDFLQSI